MPRTTHAFFFRARVGAEFDLLLEHADGQRWVVEIKLSAAPRTTRGFHIAPEDLSPSESVEAIGLVEMRRLLAETN